jgi:Putative exonuclease SbcCD, C subunit/P-loop containing region of AAA domain
MMELRHLALVNWHLFDIEDIEVGGHMGVLGENRSGKSTILDMAQVVLTGGNRKFQRLNAVAGESSKGRGGSPKRSVAGYCLGALGEDQTRRNEARTYIALGFEDSDGMRPPVTIGLALEARKSESNETVLGRFVAVGKVLKSEDFVEVRQGRRYPAQWDDVRARMVSVLGADNFINHRDRPGDYVREYMRHLLPHLPYGEQNAAALQKAVVNAMTMNQNQTATEFVRRFILEENPIRVGELRESIQTYRNINVTIQKMREKLDALKALRAILRAFEDALERKAREQWLAKRAEWLAARAANRDIKERLRTEVGQREAAHKELEFLDEEIAGIEKEIERLIKAIAEHDAQTGRERLLQLVKSAAQEAGRAESDFRKRSEAIRNLAPISAMRGMGFDEHVPVVERLGTLASDAAVARLPADLADAETAFLAVAAALLEQVDERRQKLFKEVGDKRDARDQIMQRVRQHAAGQSSAHLGESTELLCRKLRQSGMAPRVLCELVEVADPEWTGAAEALLGRDREAVFVDRADIVAATAIFKEGRREFRGASLVSLNKLEQFQTPPQAGTFPSIFHSDDPDALAFIMRRYGNVRLADTLSDFNAPGRAIMKDGLYDDGLIRSHRFMEPRHYKIGKSAQARLLTQLAEEAEELDELIVKGQAAAAAMDRAHHAIKFLTDDTHVGLAALAAVYAAAQAEKVDVETRIAALEGAGDGGLRDRHKAQLGLKTTRASERKAQQLNFSKHDKEAAVLERKLADGDNVPGSDLNLKGAWSAFLQQLPLYSPRRGRPAHRARLEARRHKTETDRHRAIAAKAVDDAAAADLDRQNTEVRARDALKDYFNAFGVSAQIGTESRLLAEVKPWMEQLIEDIEANELRRYERQAREAAEKAATLLRGEFINALTARINKMERELESVNRSLHAHPFHNERYSFHRTTVADFQPVLKIIEIGKTSPDALDMLFRGDVPDNFQYRDTILALEALLEDPEKDFSQFEDYRNFYTFEIHMQDVTTGRMTRWETRRGTGSGAEQQVPIYVAIGASLASVYGSAERRHDKPSGISLAIFDEAFSKMDGKNQRQMMSFYKDLGLQIIIAAPFEKRVAVLEHMETIVEIDRIGEQSRASVVRLKERARQELMAIDPDLMSDADLAIRMAAE